MLLVILTGPTAPLKSCVLCQIYYNALESSTHFNYETSINNVSDRRLFSLSECFTAPSVLWLKNKKQQKAGFEGLSNDERL